MTHDIRTIPNHSAIFDIFECNRFGEIDMTNEHMFTLALLLLAQAVTLSVLWATHVDREWWRKTWLRDSAELLHWKRHATLRDAKTGRYVKKDKRNG